MCQAETHLYLAGRVVRVLAEFVVHALEADCVCDFSDSEAGFVQNGDDALVRLLY